MRLLTLALALSHILACTKKPSDDASLLSSTVRAAIAERERKIVSYRFDAETVQGDQRAQFSFAFRAPGKMRGDLKTAGKVFVFDGKRFHQWDETEKVLTEIDLSSAAKEQAALFLHQTFAPFAPEGFRSPLLGGQLHLAREPAEGAQRLAVTAAVGDGVAVTFLLAPPAMDYLGKRVAGGGECRVTAQHCDAALKLCFPSSLEESVPGSPAAVTTLTAIEINAALPPEHFELTLPAGARTEKRALASP
jgi:outer membrane lipoprotein-sorting protein